MTFVHLHSIMYLLIQETQVEDNANGAEFTFHNVSINSYLLILSILIIINLHSIMYLLIR